MSKNRTLSFFFASDEDTYISDWWFISAVKDDPKNNYDNLGDYETKFDKTRGFEFKFAIRNGLLT